MSSGSGAVVSVAQLNTVHWCDPNRPDAANMQEAITFLRDISESSKR